MRTAAISSLDDLAAGLSYARTHAEEVGRTEPLTICFVPDGLLMGDDGAVDGDQVVRSLSALAALGVTWATVSLPGATTDLQRRALDEFASTVLDRIADLGPDASRIP